MGYVKDVAIGSSTYPVEPMLYAVAGGTASAITASIPNFDLHTGACVQIKMVVDNAVAPTLKVEDSPSKIITYKNGTGLDAGFLKAGFVYAFVYDGTDWTLIGQNLEVVDNLSSAYTNKALSAAQGKALQDTKVNTSDIVNNLTSTAADKPLSAAQGKALNDTISTITEQVIESVGGYFTERSAFKARCTVSMMVIDSFISITTQVPDNSSFGHVPAGFYGKLIAINVNTRACYAVGINNNGDFVTLDNPLPVAYYYFVGAAMKTA